MVARKEEARTKLIVGVFVVAMVLLGGVSLYLVGASEGTWDAKTTIQTDFKTITGLRKGSPVWLSGVSIGTVQAVDFVDVSYECDSASEDVGRYAQGRTDNCDSSLFCAPVGLCADLEPWASKGMHAPCLSDQDCGQAEICVTKDFRRRYRRVYWGGTDGVCARYVSEHKRVRVTLSIFEDALALIRTDSRASVAQAGILGDQLVNITAGMRDPVLEGGRIQSTPSLYEDIFLFRDRIEALIDKVDSSLSGISNLFSELNDENTISNIKGIIANVHEITRQIKDGDGLIGSLVNDESYAGDFATTLRHVRDTAAGLDRFVGRANGTLGKIDDNLQPAIEDARAMMSGIRKVIDGINDPKNKSVVAQLLHDNGEKRKDLVAALETIVDDIGKVVSRIEKGQGTVGKLVNDPKAHDDLVKILRGINRNKGLKMLIRGAIKADEANDPAAPASPPSDEP